jgi:hypothetical protein
MIFAVGIDSYSASPTNVGGLQLRLLAPDTPHWLCTSFGWIPVLT